MVENRKYLPEEIDYVLSRLLADWPPKLIVKAFIHDHAPYWKHRDFTCKQVSYIKGAYKRAPGEVQRYTGPLPTSPLSPSPSPSPIDAEDFFDLLPTMSVAGDDATDLTEALSQQPAIQPAIDTEHSSDDADMEPVEDFMSLPPEDIDAALYEIEDFLDIPRVDEEPANDLVPGQGPEQYEFGPQLDPNQGNVPVHQQITQGAQAGAHAGFNMANPSAGGMPNLSSVPGQPDLGVLSAIPYRRPPVDFDYSRPPPPGCTPWLSHRCDAAGFWYYGPHDRCDILVDHAHDYIGEIRFNCYQDVEEHTRRCRLVRVERGDQGIGGAQGVGPRAGRGVSAADSMGAAQGMGAGQGVVGLGINSGAGQPVGLGQSTGVGQGMGAGGQQTGGGYNAHANADAYVSYEDFSYLLDMHPSRPPPFPFGSPHRPSGMQQSTQFNNPPANQQAFMPVAGGMTASSGAHGNANVANMPLADHRQPSGARTNRARTSQTPAAQAAGYRVNQPRANGEHGGERGQSAQI